MAVRVNKGNGQYEYFNTEEEALAKYGDSLAYPGGEISEVQVVDRPTTKTTPTTTSTTIDPIREGIFNGTYNGKSFYPTDENIKYYLDLYEKDKAVADTFSAREYGKLALAELGGAAAALGGAAVAPVVAPYVTGGLNLYGMYEGTKNLLSKDGLAKTYNLFKNGDYKGGFFSALGDAVDAAITIPGLRKISQGSKWVADRAAAATMNSMLNRLSPKYTSTFDLRSGKLFLRPRNISFDNSNNLIETQINNSLPIYKPYFLTAPSIKPKRSLSFLEKLGLSKGDRNNLNKFLKDAIDDLNLYIESGLYRQVPYLNDLGEVYYASKSNKDTLIKLLKTHHPELFKNTHINWKAPFGGIYTFNTKTGKIGYNAYNLFSHVDKFNTNLGEANTMDADLTRKIFLTSPQTDAKNLIGETPEENELIEKLINESSPTIDKNIMRSFWTGLLQTTKPGIYISNDSGAPPLGLNLIRSYRDMLTNKGFRYDNSGNISGVSRLNYLDIVNQLLKPTIYKTRHEGLSTDSYLALLKQAARENSPYELRYSPDGFDTFNNLSYDNKFISDLLEKAKSGEIPQEEFLKTFHDWVAPYGGLDAKIVNGKISIPHPFLYTKQVSTPKSITYDPQNYIINGNWDLSKLKLDIPKFYEEAKKGLQDTYNWLTSSAYQEAAKANAEEAKNMGLDYINVSESPEFKSFYERVNSGKPLFLFAFYGDGTRGFVTNQDDLIHINLSSKGNIRNTAAHEGAHKVRYAWNQYIPGKSPLKVNEYLRYLNGKVFKDDADFTKEVGNLFYNFSKEGYPHEAAANTRDLGKAYGIEVGQEYPGDDAMTKLIDKMKSEAKSGFLLKMINSLKTDKESLKYVWKALNGTLWGGLGLLLYSNDK